MFFQWLLSSSCAVLLLIPSPTLEAPHHTDKGTAYGNRGIQTYAETKHGPDGAVFLDPYFIPYLLEGDGELVLDAGCGAGPWALLAAEEGARSMALISNPA